MLDFLTEQDKMTYFGEWLLTARKQAGLSQEELADRSDISKNYISVLERNLPNYKTGALPQPSKKVVKSIAFALGRQEDEAMIAAGYTPEPAARIMDVDDKGSITNDVIITGDVAKSLIEHINLLRTEIAELRAEQNKNP